MLSKRKLVKRLTRITYIEPGLANAFPNLDVTWDKATVKTTPQEVREALGAGRLGIVTASGDDKLRVGVMFLIPDQVDVAAKRVRQILENAAG